VLAYYDGLNGFHIKPACPARRKNKMLSNASHHAQQVFNGQSAMRLHTHCASDWMVGLAQPGWSHSALAFDAAAPTTTQAKTGSARRKLWDLSPTAACPVTGVCLDFEEIKGMAGKLGWTVNAVPDYDLHCLVLDECHSRSPLGEMLHRALDLRFAQVIKQAQRIKTTEALAQLWDEVCQGTDWAGEFWALLTHPRCSAELERIVLGQVHMLQHQMGHTTRSDAGQIKQLLAEQQRLVQELAASRQRVHTLTGEHAAAVASLQAACVRLRASAIRAETERDMAQTQLREIARFEPDVFSRQRQLDDAHREQPANEKLRSRAPWRERPSADQARMALVTESADNAEVERQTTEPAAPSVDLSARHVLCVGGRTSSIPVYREVIVNRGASFTHHDGGEEDKAGRLVRQLQAADVVICQVGCISHDAYWRVKEHCKRTGKPCLFVEMSGRSALERALSQMSERYFQALKAA
jgi:hypothetical protein